MRRWFGDQLDLNDYATTRDVAFWAMGVWLGFVLGGTMGLLVGAFLI